MRPSQQWLPLADAPQGTEPFKILIRQSLHWCWWIPIMAAANVTSSLTLEDLGGKQEAVGPALRLSLRQKHLTRGGDPCRWTTMPVPG